MSLLDGVSNPTQVRKTIIELTNTLIAQQEYDRAYKVLHPFAEWIENLKFIMMETDIEVVESERKYVETAERLSDALMVKILKHTEMYH